MISENDIFIENDDVQILSGDFDVRDANNQNVKHICIAQPGQFIGAPSIGAMIYRFQNDSVQDFRHVFKTIAAEIIKDGYRYPDFVNNTSQENSAQLTILAKRVTSPKREVI